MERDKASKRVTTVVKLGCFLRLPGSWVYGTVYMHHHAYVLSCIPLCSRSWLTPHAGASSNCSGAATRGKRYRRKSRHRPIGRLPPPPHSTSSRLRTSPSRGP